MQLGVEVFAQARSPASTGSNGSNLVMHFLIVLSWYFPAFLLNKYAFWARVWLFTTCGFFLIVPLALATFGFVLAGTTTFVTQMLAKLYSPHYLLILTAFILLNSAPSRKWLSKKTVQS